MEEYGLYGTRPSAGGEGRCVILRNGRWLCSPLVRGQRGPAHHRLGASAPPQGLRPSPSTSLSWSVSRNRRWRLVVVEYALWEQRRMLHLSNPR